MKKLTVKVTADKKKIAKFRANYSILSPTKRNRRLKKKRSVMIDGQIWKPRFYKFEEMKAIETIAICRELFKLRRSSRGHTHKNSQDGGRLASVLFSNINKKIEDYSSTLGLEGKIFLFLPTYGYSQKLTGLSGRSTGPIFCFLLISFYFFRASMCEKKNSPSDIRWLDRFGFSRSGTVSQFLFMFFIFARHSNLLFLILWFRFFVWRV